MANHHDKRVGETLIRIGIQAREIVDYIFDKEKNKGHIGLKELKDMSNVIVSNIKYLEELDKKGGQDA